MAMSAGSDDGEPMMEMNTTPLIDVMLVLLIMFIITIPIQTHAVKVDLPQGSGNPNPVQADKNKITINAAGEVAWNGSPVTDVTLRQYLDQAFAGFCLISEYFFQICIVNAPGFMQMLCDLIDVGVEAP